MTTDLSGRTFLLGPSPLDVDIATEVMARGARVIRWPQPLAESLQTAAALDEGIENLFGYDWIVFRNVHAAEYFLSRFSESGRELSNLDDLRVAAIGAATAEKLTACRIHLDLQTDDDSTSAIVAAFRNFVGGADELRCLNFLIPAAEFTFCQLGNELENVGARADVVPTYRLAARDRLAQIAAWLAGGGIDYVVFTDAAGVRGFAELFDARNLSQLLAATKVICELAAAAAVTAMDRPPDTIADAPAVSTFMRAIESQAAAQI